METNNSNTNNINNNEVNNSENGNKSTHELTAKQLKRQRIRQLVVSMIGVAILVWGIVKIGCMFMDYKSNEKSDDAQVEQYISPVNMRASGYIKKIYFKEHQDVKKGDTLLVLDDREYRIRMMEAEAALKDAMAGANVVDASLQTTQTSATVYEASIAEIEIRLAKLDKDRQRYQNLVARNAATPIQLEQIETEYNATKKKLDAVRRQQKAAYSGVIANYKETQVEKLYVGQKVTMTVDAFEGKEFQGKITAISGATGSKYSLVPTDNSAGNFVKIQQRVPVRIEFEGLSKEDNDKLAAGMMVVVKAQLK